MLRVVLAVFLSVQIVCCIAHPVHEGGSPQTSGEMICGGYHNMDEEDESVKNAVLFAVDEINSQSNSVEKLQLHKVRNVQTQVVAGLNYKIEMELQLPSGKPEIHLATVYQDLQGQLHLSQHARSDV